MLRSFNTLAQCLLRLAPEPGWQPGAGRVSLTQWEKTGRKQTSKQIMSGVMSAVKKEAG